MSWDFTAGNMSAPPRRSNTPVPPLRTTTPAPSLTPTLVNYGPSSFPEPAHMGPYIPRSAPSTTPAFLYVVPLLLKSRTYLKGRLHSPAMYQGDLD
ncbi:hypothetical protein V5O48_014818 [Marasmius crinis-equi]|uniref:Uncharacterized protein n=1 Tax=Marasmius crinis-equi TaxID=585013 RepID=A0ABR3EW71_9AGAR